MIGLYRIWKHLTRRANLAAAEQVAAQARLEHTQREVERLRQKARENKFADDIRAALRYGYRTQGGSR